jgi:ABC-type nitrate/sulfonate/bicarbonate transport system substrate-binding protein
MSNAPEIIHYSRCRMVPTPSSLAAQLEWLREQTERISQPPVRIEFGDYDHRNDRYWMRHAANTKALYARARGADAHVVAFSACEVGEHIFVRADSNVQTLEDLKGRRLAIPRIANRRFDMDRHVYMKPYITALQSVGLTLSDVELVDTVFERPKLCDAPPEPRNFFEAAGEVFLEQLLARRVDAAATVVRPRSSEGLREIYCSRADNAPMARGELRALIVSGPLLREHRAVVVGFVECLLRAGEWAANHPSDVPALVGEDIGLSAEALAQREIEFDSWSRVSCSPHDQDVMQQRMAWLLAAGIIKAPVNLREWIDPTVMHEAMVRLGQLSPRVPPA